MGELILVGDFSRLVYRGWVEPLSYLGNCARKLSMVQLAECIRARSRERYTAASRAIAHRAKIRSWPKCYDPLGLRSYSSRSVRAFNYLPRYRCPRNRFHRAEGRFTGKSFGHEHFQPSLYEYGSSINTFASYALFALGVCVLSYVYDTDLNVGAN